ncbi:Protein NO VEIN-like protein [Cladobotryum mycophilum]|uniref:Protein NO VEIN-like protein n=1 Tax=Cladobotryum mycophilum TaxID=491253 RepID=A0ABR0SRI7_9HYPO
MPERQWWESPRGNGFIDDDVMGQIEQWNPSIRRMIEESMLAKDKLAAHSIKTDARFVFELLQNADDNRFTKAKASGALPFISFEVHPDCIIVECNEDGFTKNDLSAICSVGESTKSASHGYIGAKGIGFKSVFIAAWRVYIQSGNFSFYFKHGKGDLGLGMVLPIWEEAEEELPVPLTRMKLHLHEKGDANDLKHLRRTIFRQLADLQQTCLLFLRNLKHIHIAFYDEDGDLESSKDFRIGELDRHSVCIDTDLTNAEGETASEKKIYHVTKHTATGLSKSDNREVPETDEARRTSSRAEVILAFPLTSDLKPVVANQDIFAFLPVRESNFHFLIQSDFDTSANRQDIITTSRRNFDLLDGIAATFIKAIFEFCEHPKLSYTWPEFLPPPDDDSGGFWSGLNQRIGGLIVETPILMSRHGRRLRTIDDVVIVDSDFKDENGEPLLDDPVLDPFISDQYPMHCQSALQSYGLRVLYGDRILRLLHADLESPASRIKSESTDEEWHSALAAFLTETYEKDMSKLYRFTLLPLRTGQWVATDNNVVYLPTTGRVPIPPGVNMRVLDPAAVSNNDRKSLFTQLGAVEPSILEVRSSIMKIYGASVPRISMAESRAHLHYLYLTHQPKQSKDTLKVIYIYDSNGKANKPHEVDLYLQSDYAYGPEALLEPVDDEPGLEVAFVHPAYLEDVPNPPSSTKISWRKWLHEFIGVRERLRLVCRDGDDLSDAWYYIAENRPKKLLGLLKHLWTYEGPIITGSDDLTA